MSDVIGPLCSRRRLRRRANRPMCQRIILHSRLSLCSSIPSLPCRCPSNYSWARDSRSQCSRSAVGC
ncbi:hypothetical protein Mapa_015962 [Marchantia paleacea]|nr:hypothetical protein Mapa_015962 [Marchantia paleacea]